MSGSSYLWAWAIYLLAAVVLMFSCWRMSASWNGWLRLPVRALIAALVLVPVSAAPDHAELAPAWLVWFFDVLMQDDVSGWRAARPLLLFIVVALAAGLFAAWREHRRPSGSGAGDEAAVDG